MLYHCVSVSLALLSPFMPFLTEELWQRLYPLGSQAGSAVSSLCVQPYPQSAQLVRELWCSDHADVHQTEALLASFLCFSFLVLTNLVPPTYQAHLHFPQEEADFTLVREVVRVARSLRAQCGITKEKPDSKSCLTCSKDDLVFCLTNSSPSLLRTSSRHVTRSNVSTVSGLVSDSVSGSFMLQCGQCVRPARQRPCTTMTQLFGRWAVSPDSTSTALRRPSMEPPPFPLHPLHPKAVLWVSWTTLVNYTSMLRYFSVEYSL